MTEESKVRPWFGTILSAGLGTATMAAAVVAAMALDTVHFFGPTRILWPLVYWCFPVAAFIGGSLAAMRSSRVGVLTISLYLALQWLVCSGFFVFLRLLGSGAAEPYWGTLRILQVPFAIAGFITCWAMPSFKWLVPTVTAAGCLALGFVLGR